METKLQQSIGLRAAVYVPLALTALLLITTKVHAQQDKPDTAPTEEQEWITHLSSDGAMQVSFPSKPVVSNSTQESAIGEIKLEIIQVETANFALTASSTRIPVDPADYDAAAGLEGSVQGVVGDNEVIESRDIKKDGLPGKELILKTSNGYFLRARTYVDGSAPQLFQVNVVARTQAQVEDETALKFLDSIVFKGERKPTLKWSKTNLADDSYSVEFPATPQISKSGDPVTEMGEAFVGETNFVAAATTYDIDPNEFDVDKAIENVIASKSDGEYSLLKSSEAAHDNLPGAEIFFKDTSEVHYRQFCYFDDSIPRLYQVLIAAKDPNELNNETAEKFLKSFALLARDADGWFNKSSTDGTMKLRFPAQPEVSTQKLNSPAGELNMEIMQALTDDAAFTSISTAYPVDPDDFDVQAGLEGAVSSMRQGSELLEEKEISIGGFPGVEVLIKNPDGIYVRARSYVDPAIPAMYQLNVAGDNQEKVSNDLALKFLDSIQIVESNKK